MAKDWTTVGADNSETHDFEKEKTLEGIYVGRKDDIGDNNSTIYNVRLDDGTIKGFWGSAVLNSKMAQIPANNEVRITYLGREKNPKNGREYKNFEIQTRTPGDTGDADMPF